MAFNFESFYKANNSPFLVAKTDNAVDPDQIAACWRFISRKKADRDTDATDSRNLIRMYIQTISGIEGEHNARLKSAITNYGRDYNDFQAQFPGGPYLNLWAKNGNEIQFTVAALPRQIEYEADFFALDTMILKGCLLAWAKIELDLSPWMEAKLKKAMKYFGKPLFFVGVKTIFTDPYEARRTGGRKNRFRKRKGYLSKYRSKYGGGGITVKQGKEGKPYQEESVFLEPIIK
jgi:hypothetical protein